LVFTIPYRDPSPVNGLLQRGFLLCRISNLADITGGNEQLLLVLEPEPFLVLDLALDPAPFINPDPILDLDPGLAHFLNPSEPRISGEGGFLEEDPILDPVPRGGLSDVQKRDFERVFIEMFPDSASSS
jgi:hypothetical protein